MGGVAIRDGQVLLVRRGKEPLYGRWVIPGGTVEAGESLEAALVREMREETGLLVEVGEPILVFDRILYDADGALSWHYVIVDYLCEVRGGTLQAGSDALDAAWAAPADLERFSLPQKAYDVVMDAFRRTGVLPGAGVGRILR